MGAKQNKQCCSSRLPRVLATVITLTLLAGCKSPPFGAPPPSSDFKKQVKSLENGFDETKLVTAYNTSTNDEATKAGIRGTYIQLRIQLVDLQYEHFVNSSTFKRQVFDTASEIVVLGVDAATTLVGGQTTKSILGAVSGGITGSKSSFEKNFFYEKTMQVLVSGMNAARQKVLVDITKGLGETSTNYPLGQAVVDLNRYYDAGTFIGALNSIQTDSSASAKTSKDTVDAVKTVKSTKTEMEAAVSSGNNDRIGVATKAYTNAVIRLQRLEGSQ